MNPWLDHLHAELAQLDAAGLLRRLTPVARQGRWIERRGRSLLNLAGNDYLGLAEHPRLKAAAVAALETHGTGSGASRLVSGHDSLIEQVEQRFAAFKHAEAALLCPTGYQANLAAVTALARPGDLICLDKLCHASLIDAARLSGAMVRVYPHGNLAKLERLLAAQSKIKNQKSKILILTDSVFSMDGDVANLPALCDLAERHGALLIVDEAHGTGVLGASGAGLCELQGVTERVAVVVSTASKALGGLGGIITARRVVIDTIINRARSFIYTTATPPAQAAVIGAALDVVRDEPSRRARLASISRALRAALHLPVEPPTPIIPVIVGDARAALAMSAALEERGYFAPAIRPPTVPRGKARVRISLRADLQDEELAGLGNTLATLGDAI